MKAVLKFITNVLPGLLAAAVDIFEAADDGEGSIFAGLVAQAIAAPLGPEKEDALGRFFVSMGDSLVRASPPADPDGDQ